MAALAAGPWPLLPAAALLWRVPLVAAALLVARGMKRAVWLAVVVVCLAALVLDTAVPATRPVSVVVDELSAAVRRLQDALGEAADTAELRRVMVPGGAEADPELPFDALSRAVAAAGVAADATVLVDERGAPVAWTGRAPRLPLRLRTLGDRTVASEAALDEVWLWWREPILEAGRPRGALLAGVALAEGGARSALGVWCGRAGLLVARLAGGAPVQAPTGSRLIGVEVVPGAAAPWSAAASAVLVVAVILLLGGVIDVAVVVLAAFPAVALAGAWLPRGWLVVIALGVLTALARRLGEGRWSVLLGAGLAGAAVALVAAAAPALDTAVAPHSLLWPGALVLALAWSLTVLLRSVPGGAGRWPLAALAWVTIAGAVWRADPFALAAGVAMAAAWGFRRARTVAPALAAALVLVTIDAATGRERLVTTTERTMGRLERVSRPAEALLASLPGEALAKLARLSPREQLVVLGRLASWLRFGETLPGCTLAVLDEEGATVTAWGEVPQWGEEVRELAVRPLVDGLRLAVLCPPAPEDVLAALTGPRTAGPVAVFSRSGAPIGRGATFRPLSSERVGRALARGRSWDTVGVGERELTAYMRAAGEQVVAVPWWRPPPAETALLLTALTLWAALPVAVWAGRERWRTWWRERVTLTGRLRLLSVAIIVVPLVLLGNLLPRQWGRQRELSRLELARVVSEPLSREGWEEELAWLVRDLGGAVTLYRGGELVSSTHPDLAVRGEVPWLVPRDAYVRAVRGWYEPIVEGGAAARLFAPLPGDGTPIVIGVTGLRQLAATTGSLPAEWFVVTGAVGLLLALAAAERLGRRLTRPLHELVRAVKRLERGEAVEGIEAPADEEVATLSRSFEAMARSVRRREEELRGERDLLGEVLGTLSAAVVVLVGDGEEVELANPAARRLFDRADGLEALRERFGDAFTTLLARAARRERASATVRPTGSPETLWRVTTVPLAGTTVRTLVVMEDLSEVARAERLASLAELARIVAHEVKNPLTPIRLWAEEIQAAIERGGGDIVDIARRAAEQILDRVQHLHEVAQGFSNLVALETWQPERVVVADLAAEVAAEYEVLGQRGVRVERASRGETAVVADPTWLRRALRHLLENSIRAIGAGGGRIVLDVVGDGAEVVVSVSDSGGGVADEHLGKLFEPHFSTTSEGSGLGLAVVERVASRAGGRVTARNLAQGLEVRLVLPAA